MSIIIVGTGRSGTSWLGNILNYDGYYDYIFEPLNPNNKSKQAQYFGKRKYVCPDCSDLECVQMIKEVFDSGNTKLIKTVRAHLMVPWIYENLKNSKIIFLLRHPCAVTWSWVDRNWEPPLQEIFEQSDLLADYPVIKDIQKQINSDWGIFEKQMLLWCVENYVALKYLLNHNPDWKRVYILFYGDLVRYPKNCLNDIYKRILNREYDNGIFDVVNKPSRTCRKGSAVLTGEDKLMAWKSHVPEHYQEWAFELVKGFGLEGYFKF